MAYNKKIITVDNSKEPFTGNSRSKSLMSVITAQLSALEKLQDESPVSQSFCSALAKILAIFDEYQKELVAHSEYEVTCVNGCSTCCNHWVADVNSFEAEIIADFLRTTLPEKIDEIIRQSLDDCEEMERLELLMDQKMQEVGMEPEKEQLDTTDLLLSVFYQLRRPCPLLDEKENCMVYPVRPLTCRMYVSVSDPIRCDPDYTNDNDIPTCLTDLSKQANTILDRLHFRYVKYEGDTGLRSLLVNYLGSKDCQPIKQ